MVGMLLVDIDLATAGPEAAGYGHGAHRDVMQLGVRRFGQVLDALVFPGGLSVSATAVCGIAAVPVMGSLIAAKIRCAGRE